MIDPTEKTEQALSDKARLGVTEAEWNWAMERVFAMQANGSKAGAAILLIEAARQEREACAKVCDETPKLLGVHCAEAIRSRSSATGENG